MRCRACSARRYVLIHVEGVMCGCDICEVEREDEQVRGRRRTYGPPTLTHLGTLPTEPAEMAATIVRQRADIARLSNAGIRTEMMLLDERERAAKLLVENALLRNEVASLMLERRRAGRR